MNWTLPLRAWLARAPGGLPRRARTALTGFAALLIGVIGLVGALGSADAARPGPAAQPEAHGTSASGSGTRAFGLREGAASVPSMDAKLAPASPPSHSSLSSAPDGDQPGTDDGQPARVEESGAITIVVRGAEIQPDVSALSSLAAGNGGFVASTSTESAAPGNPAQGTVTLQIPEGRFDSVLDQVKTYGKVASLMTTAQDVTGQYVDLQAQITALEDSRQQYLTIMTKATTIGGILAVQSQLDNLQGQLDQLQGQLKNLGSETTYATLAVTLSQTLVTPPTTRPPSGLALAWRSAVHGFVAGCEDVVRLAGPVLFALLLVGVVVLMSRAAWRFSRRSP